MKIYPITPPEFFAPLQERFKFTIDVAAEDYNAVLPRFWTPEDDGLSKSWAGERVWCNPPYDDIEPWLEKAWREDKADLIVMLLPADRTWMGWWQHYIEPHRDQSWKKGDEWDMRFERLRTEFLPGRMRHVLPDGVPLGGLEGEAWVWGKIDPERPYGHVLAIFE